ncbi:MAG: type II toxin-antitoxin system PemK/MazF family toxin [Kiritimatiellia bacterium]
MKRGELWWVSLPEPYGSEPGYRRPMLIVQADSFNMSAIKTVLCAAMTTNLNLGHAPGNVQVTPRTSGLPKPSVVNVSQIVTVDRTLMTERIKLLDADTMKRIDDGLRLVMNL